MKLEEYQTAKTALEMGATLSTDKSRFLNLIKECDKLIAGNFVLFVVKLILLGEKFIIYLFVFLFTFGVLDF